MDWLRFANVIAATALSGALNGLWLGLLLAGFAAVLLRLMPRSNATTRYALWITILPLMLVVPVLFLLVPRTSAPPLGISAPASAVPLTLPVTAGWPVYLALAWLAVTAILMARVAWSLHHIHSLKRNATVLGTRGNVRLLASADIRVPMAAGFFRRAIIFPQSLLAPLSSEEFDQVLCHELAHLRRGDDWTQLLQAISEAILFFNPVVHWIGRRLEIEREIACDDWVVLETGKARPYAACLTHLHELTRTGRAPQLAPGATGKRRWQISTRVEALLAADRHAAPGLSRAGWLAAGALASVALVMAIQVTPPVGVADVPVAAIPFARLHTPAVPAMALTRTDLAQTKALPVKPRLLAKRAPKPAEDTGGFVLVRAWRLEAPANYLVITVVLFEPPPPPASLNRT